jgi:hypothetical protein
LKNTANPGLQITQQRAHLGKAGLAREWPKLAAACTSIGDATIKDVAEYYGEAGYEVIIVTVESGLKAYEPAQPRKTPQRQA